MSTALVNKIIPFSSVDGPGNRTAIFLQGCNINCKYCHNPETRKVCISCGECVSACPAGALTGDDVPAGSRVVWDPAKCVQCDTCIHLCRYDASPRVRRMSPEEVMNAVRRQIPFIRGISVSGGECTLHPRFLTELFALAKKDGLTTLIDSNGTVLFEQLPELMRVTDGVMLDIKAFDEKEHIAVTDASNRNVLRNAVWLAEQERLYEVRCVIAPDLYDVRESVRRSGELLLPYYLEQREKALRDGWRKEKGDPAATGVFRPFRWKLIAYRPMGVRGEYARQRVPSQQELRELRDILREQGYENIVLI